MNNTLKPFRVKYLLALIAFVCVGSAAGVADTITLKDGQTLKGKLIERTESGVKFEIGGQRLQFYNANIKSLEVDFTAPEQITRVKAPTTAQPSKSYVIPVGSILRVRNITMLNSSKTGKGDPFVVTLDSAVFVDGVKVLSPGTKISGRVVEAVKGGRVAKQAKLAVELTVLELAERNVPIRTEPYQVQGERQGTLRKVAIGSAIGKIDNDLRGAQKGTAYGGVAAVATRGKQVAIPPGTLIDFKLAVQVKL